MATDAVTGSDLAMDRGPTTVGLDVPAPGTTTATSVRPYAPSWLDRLVDWIEGLPGPTWLAYAGLVAVFVAVSVAASLPSGTYDQATLAGQAFWGLVLPLTLWMAHYLSRVAGSAFDDFRPALTAPDDEARDLRYRLTVTPARPAAVIFIVTAVLTPLYYLVDPAGSNIIGLTPLGLGLRYVNEVLFGALLFVIVYQSLRQLRAVSRIHAAATRIDLFRRAPLYAFSILTSRTAMVIAVAFIVPTLVAAVQASTESTWLLILPWIVVAVVVAALVFTLPLRGMQRRILAEKHRLQDDVGMRIERTMLAIHARIDDGDLVGAGEFQGALGVLLTERDIVDKLPTLPWRPGTLGGLFTAVGLPIVLFLITKALERVV